MGSDSAFPRWTVFAQPLFDALPFPQQCFVRDAYGDLSWRICVRNQQPLFNKAINEAFH
jgi:hypothetical protein